MMTELSKYALERVRHGSEFVLYRGLSASEPRHILVVALASESPAPESIRRLEHEYELRNQLDPAWAARPVGLVRDNGQTCLLLEDPGGQPLDRLLDRALDLAQIIRIAIGLSGALSKLHERGIIHRDIKPGNIIADESSGAVWLTGFGIASDLSRGSQRSKPPEILAGTLAYIAPEQTGRIKYSIDSRSDLYSLGVTLYQMLTGVLPFNASDPIEWIHCHVARQAPQPIARKNDVPEPLSAIVVKLLAKGPEDRYQTAEGLKADLGRCLRDWESLGRIDPFVLGAEDVSRQLRLPQRLYGREKERATLLEAFNRIVSSGIPELVLVSGYAGIGKSSLVNELQKMLVPARALFASGKFDQYKRDIPYFTLAQALRSLIRQLLAESEAELSGWREALREALGPNGKLMVDLVPELKLIVGEQPPIPDLPPQQAQSRFQLVFRRLIGVFARPEHPLALFLDDLQWLDAATLDLLEDLLTQSDVGYLLLIGAYRDNEVTRDHLLRRKLDAIIRQIGSRVQEISLTPLTRDFVGQLIADALGSESARAAPLAGLVHEKTAGNPFFLMQFLDALAEEGLLAFDHDQAQWCWDLERIHAKGFTDNVVDLMVSKLHRLPLETRTAVQQLACLGNRAEIAILSIALGTSEEQVHAALGVAVRLDLIERLPGWYRFVHDRVQEAAYTLMPDELRAEAHLRIGRLLAAHTPPEKHEEAIFEIVNQLNRGAALITVMEEREQLADLNLVAGKRAKASSAYASALAYLSAGAALLTEDGWEGRYGLRFALEFYRAECEFLTGELEAAEQRLGAVWERATNVADRAAVTCLLVDLYTTLNQNGRAIAIGLQYLREQGVEWSPHPTEVEARREYQSVWSRLGRRAIDDLIGLPLMTDSAALATMDVLNKMATPALGTDSNLPVLVASRAVNLSLERGNCDGSCLAYERLAIVAGARFANYEAASSLGRLGCELVERRGLTRFEAGTYLLFESRVLPWTKHVKSGRELLRRGLDAATRVGDLIYAAYGCSNLIRNMLSAGDPLSDTQREAERGVEFARKIRYGFFVDLTTVQLQLIRVLRGLTLTFGCLDDGKFDERQFERHLSDNPASQRPECYYWIRKLQARFLAGDLSAALDAASKAQPLLSLTISQLETADYHFYAGLSHAGMCDTVTGDERQQHLDAVAPHCAPLEVWADNCPENFGSQAALVGAEIARLEGRELDAERLYEQAIRAARIHCLVHNEALAYELAARFYKARGFERIADFYLRNARYCYLLWGADGKVRQLGQRYPHLRENRVADTLGPTIEAPFEQLDVGTVVKASQAVSREIVLAKLIETLMKISIAHAGGNRGLLFLLSSNDPQIEAEASTSGADVQVILRQSFATPPTFAESILRYVLRTRRSVILDDASAENPFSTDPYVQAMRARSILCLPLVKQGTPIGALYLENNLTARVFTPDRLAILELLATQAAISLENAKLYSDLRASEERWRSIFESSSLGIAIMGGDLRFIASNVAFKVMLGYTDEELGDLTPVDISFDEDRNSTRKLLTDLQQKKVQHLELVTRYRRKDNALIWVNIYASIYASLVSDEKAAPQLFCTTVDITASKRAQDALRAMQSELARVGRISTMGQMTASIAHEINQPITAIVASGIAATRFLKRTPPDLDEVHDALKRIARDGHRAGKVIAGIRSMLHKDKQEDSLIDINDLVRATLALVHGELGPKGVRVNLELFHSLPQVSGNRVQLMQVFLNLLMNGIEAMDSINGERVLRVKSQVGDSDQVVVDVIDSGVGIDPENIERIFDTFFTTKSQGMGMGLSICRSIIEAHNGRLWASANSDQGSVFHVQLPPAG
jgi:PAS domain S-box-containing protein